LRIVPMSMTSTIQNIIHSSNFQRLEADKSSKIQNGNSPRLLSEQRAQG
jgi:hypothetical protein